MTVSRRKGDPGKADELFRRIVHSRGACERCGGPATDCAHIIGRVRSAPRCLEDNAWMLCRTCHERVDNYWHEKQAMVERTIGRERYDEMLRLADDFTSSLVSTKRFWVDEVARLKARCEELGIDTRSKRPAA